jgi:hypothetical protein
MPSETRYPAHWTDSAIDAIETVLEAQPDLDGPAFAALAQAAELISTADALDEVARAANFVIMGSKGQPAKHPALGEARLARSAAATILGRLANTKSQISRRNVRKRWEKRV